MSEQKSHGALKPILEFGPVIAFFVAYLWLKDEVFTVGGTEYAGFIVITAFFIPLIWISTGLFKWLTGSVSKMQIFTAVIVTIFGGLTVWLNDESFIKMKPTILYVLFGGILGVGLIQGKSYLQSVMGDLIPMTSEGWMILTKRFTAFFFGLALLNEIVWRFFSTDTWVYFKTFGLSAAILVFIVTQGKIFEKFAVETDDDAAS